MSDATPLFDLPAAPVQGAGEGSKGRRKAAVKIRWGKHSGQHQPCGRCVRGRHAAELEARKTGRPAETLPPLTAATMVRTDPGTGARTYWCEPHAKLAATLELAVIAAGKGTA